MPRFGESTPCLASMSAAVFVVSLLSGCGITNVVVGQRFGDAGTSTSDGAVTGMCGEVGVCPVQTPMVQFECGDGVQDGRCWCVGDPQPCWIGPLAARNIGQCRDGQQECERVSATTPGTFSAECLGAVLPSPEVCDGATDEDCDGAVDEGCPCTGVGEERACGGTYAGGVCQPGLQTCQADQRWSACTDRIVPEQEACGDELDNDCDGRTDEGCGCISVPEVCDDALDNDCDNIVDEPDCTPTNQGEACTLEPSGTCEQIASSFQLGATTGINFQTLRAQDLLDGSCSRASGTELIASGARFEGTYHFSTAGSNVDTVLYALVGGCSGPEVACVDDVAGSPAASFTLRFDRPLDIVVVAETAEPICGTLELTAQRLD